MNHILTKLWTRLSLSGLYGASQSVNNLIRFLASWLVFRYDSPELWGSFVKVALIVHLTSMVTLLGHRDYLIKLFSFNPSDIGSNWGANLFSRIPLLLAGLLIVQYWLGWQLFPLIALWLAGQFIKSFFQVLVIFERDFKFALLTETIGALCLPAAILMFRNEPTLEIILVGIASGILFQSIAYTIRFRKFVRFSYFRFDMAGLKESSVYFFPSLAGTVQARIDLYFVALYLENSALAYYQVFMSLLNFSYGLVSFAIVPYLQNLYRLRLSSFQKLQTKFALAAIAFAIVAMAAAKVIVEFYYHYHLPEYFYVIGMVNISTFSIYVIITSKLFRTNRQHIVAITSLSALLLQTVAGFFIIPAYQLDGAILVYFSGQLVVTILFVLLDRHLLRSGDQ